jgi:hypothetical protein
MTLEDECKQLMYFRDKIKEYKKAEQEIRNSIISYLKNHNQEGVIFKHNQRNITLTVKSTTPKKNISRKERECKVKDILSNAGVQNIDITTQEIIDGLRQVIISDKLSQDKLKFKSTKV